MSKPLADEAYISLETFKKDGTGVATPVWVAGLGGKLVVVTNGTSWKVKRLQRNPKVRVAPCSARGAVRGPWTDAECRIIAEPARQKAADDALRAKYGFQYWLLDLGGRIGGTMKHRTWLEITLPS